MARKQKLPNKLKEYWIEKERDWHRNIVGTYHVSTIGLSHEDLEPDDHYGPCLRQTFYEYTSPKESNLESQGNVMQGTNHHSTVQEIFRKNNPNSIIEFPLYAEDDIGKRTIKQVGSVDAITFNYDSEKEVMYIDVYDFKTASSYTLPKHESDFNITYFSQLYIYAEKLNRLFDSIMVQIRSLIIVYIDKHNLATYEIKKRFSSTVGHECNMEYNERCWLLDSHLLTDSLPDKEPMRWCKYCKYKTRCDMNMKADANLNDYTNDELANIFELTTKKKAYWNGKETKGFTQWKRQLTI